MRTLTQRPGIVHLAVVVLYMLLTLVMTWPLVRYAATAIPGDGFDGWQNYWNLWWLKTALVDRIASPFVTDILYYPTGVGLYFHTLNPLNGLMSMPVQLAFGLIPAYNFVVLISWTLAGYGAFLLCLWLLRPASGAEEQPVGADSARIGKARYAGAFLAGIVYTFAPFHMAHLLGHMQVMGLEWIPFYALFLLRGISASRSGKPWLRDAGMAGIFLVFNGLSDWYFVLYLFLFTALAIFYYLIVDLAEKLGSSGFAIGQIVRSLTSVLRTPLVAGVIFVAVLSPVLVPMVREATQFDFMVRPATDLYILSASAIDYLIPSRLHTLLREIGPLLPGNQIAPVSERTIAVGYVALVLAVVAIGLQRRRVWFWIIAGLLFFLISLGPKLHFGSIAWDAVPVDPGAASEALTWTPFGLLNRFVPFMSISRSVSRYSLMVQLSIAMLAGMGLSALLSRSSRRGVYVAATAVVALILFEFWVAPYPISNPDTPSFYEEVAKSEGAGAILNLPMNYDRPGYLLYQSVHARPLSVAYISRDDPRTLTERVPVLQHFRHLGPDIVGDDPAVVGMTVLNDLGVQYVVLDRYKMPSGNEREYTEALANAIFAGRDPVFEDQRLTVYETASSVDPVAYIELESPNWGPLLENQDGQNGGQGALSRTVGDGPACFTIRHMPDHAEVSIDYRTEPSADGQLINSVGVTLVRLEPAPDGTEVSLDVTGSGDRDQNAQYCLTSSAPHSLYIQQIRLTIP